MLTFINDNDFLLVDKYKQNNDGSIGWIYSDGNATHSGFLREGVTRTIEVEDGTERVKVDEQQRLDENGGPIFNEDGSTLLEDVFEDQIKFKTETVDIWAKFQALVEDGTLQVEGKTQEEIDSENIANFKASREVLIANSIVTTGSGNKYDGDNDSIQKMVNKILSYSYAGKSDTDTLEWSLADTGTGVMTEVTFKELKEAHHLAVEYVQSVWGL